MTCDTMIVEITAPQISSLMYHPILTQYPDLKLEYLSVNTTPMNTR